MTYLLIAAGAAIVLVPFLWMLSTSLKAEQQLFVYPPQWIPNPDPLVQLPRMPGTRSPSTASCSTPFS